MKLQTKVPIAVSTYPADYSSKLLLIGSCFAEHIGSKLDYYKLRTVQNPLGILFHARAIEKFILRAIKEEYFEEEDLFYLNERWHSFDAHSDLSMPEKEATLELLNESLKDARLSLSEATHFFITLGTAWGYRYKKTGDWVANCHKVPQAEFSKALFEVKEITESLKAIIEAVRSINPGLHFTFTVSPVRHLKDGFVENQQSKAYLIAAVQEVLALHKSDDSISYFPAYEIMMDELRDYRFYANDLVHPNELAVDYIWERFRITWISDEASNTMEKVEEIQKGINHKPFSPKSEQHKKFMDTLQKKITYLQKEYPFMDFKQR
ncbi:MAG: GSCFA domain-containing protein [Flavobacteriaceae bacterium]